MAKKKSKKSSRARRVGRSMLAGGKGTVMAAGTGVVAYYGLSAAKQHIGTVRNHWWLGPVAMVAGGHLLKKRARFAGIGASLCGIGGFVGMHEYKLRQMSQQQQPQAPQLAAPVQTEAGMLVDNSAGDAAMVYDIEDQRRSRLGSALDIGR